MGLTFNSAAAKQIYMKTLARYMQELADDPYERSDAEDKLEELFSYAARAPGRSR